MTASENTAAGKVYLVGAGPGEEGLITVRGLELLKQADLVIYDTLANPRLLIEAPAAEHIAIGGRGEPDKLTQQQINQRMADEAKAGRTVVRLKGGDPYIFGRGGEEAAFLGAAGIDVEVVPGVTAGIAAPMAAGIALTRRDIGCTVTFVTGHEDPDKPATGVDYPALAALIRRGGSVCIFMGVARFDAIVSQLQAQDLPADTPVAAVEWGFTPQQRTVRSTLDEAAGDITAAAIAPPSIMVIGRAAGLDEPGLNFYTNRPLFGRRVIITRTRHQASAFRTMLSRLGAAVLEAPTIELVEPSAEGWAEIDDAIAHIDRFDWLVLTSVNGVEALARRLDKLGRDARHFAGVRIAVIGDATQGAVRRHLCIRPDIVPPNYVAESLAKTMIEQADMSGRSVLMLRADIARATLKQMLEAAGAAVTDLPIYITRPAAALPEDALDALQTGTADWITFTSSSTARHMAELLGDEAQLLAAPVRIASIGPITSRTIRQLGWQVDVEAEPSNLEGLTAAIVAAATSVS